MVPKHANRSREKQTHLTPTGPTRCIRMTSDSQSKQRGAADCGRWPKLMLSNLKSGGPDRLCLTPALGTGENRQNAHKRCETGGWRNPRGTHTANTSKRAKWTTKVQYQDIGSVSKQCNRQMDRISKNIMILAMKLFYGTSNVPPNTKTLLC